MIDKERKSPFCCWRLKLLRSLIQRADISFVIAPELFSACREMREGRHFRTASRGG